MGFPLRQAFVFILFFLVFSEARALDKGFIALSYRPAFDRSPYLQLYDSDSLKELQSVIGLSSSFAYQPIIYRIGNSQDDAVIDQMTMMHLTAGVGIYRERLSLGVDIPVGLVRVRDPFVVNSKLENKFVLSDPMIHMKLNVMDAAESSVGLAFLTSITIPAGFGKSFVGSSMPTVAGKMIWDLRPVPSVEATLNLGINLQKKFRLSDQEMANQILYGIGFCGDVVGTFSLSAEVNGKLKLTNPAHSSRESPSEALFGMQYLIPGTGLSFSLGGGVGLVRGSEVPTWRAFGGLRYEL